MLHGIRRTFGRKCQIIRKFLLRDVCERFRCHTVAGKLIQERPDERVARSGGIRDRHRQRFGFGARVRRVDCRAARAACHKQQPAAPRKQKLCRFPLGFAAGAEFNFIIRQLHEVCTRQKLTNRCLTAFRAAPQRQTHVRVKREERACVLCQPDGLAMCLLDRCIYQIDRAEVQHGTVRENIRRNLRFIEKQVCRGIAVEGKLAVAVLIK